MKTTSKIIKMLQKRFGELEDFIRCDLQCQMDYEEKHQSKLAKLTESFVTEHQAEQREIIRVYAFIKELDFIDGCRELYNHYKEKGSK